nr:extracellular matrix/biofilm biosynthesis regulator RemA family protein [Maliibacterium massiliense]
MILHLGDDVIVQVKDIVSIIDMQESLPGDTRAFLKKAKEDGLVVQVGAEEKKSAVLCQKGTRTRVYFSPISSATLLKRSNYVGRISRL